MNDKTREAVVKKGKRTLTEEEKRARARKAVTGKGDPPTPPEKPQEQAEETPMPTVPADFDPKGEDVARMNIVYIHVDSIELNPDNTNYMTHEQFQMLVEEIERNGFMEAVKVVPTGKQVEIEGRRVAQFMMLRGEHRLRAVRSLGKKWIPAVIGRESERFDQNVDTVRGNMIRGQQDNGRFSALYDDLLAQHRGDPAALRRMMGLTEQRFQSLYQDESRRNDEKQKDMHADLTDTSARIKAVDNINVLIHQIFSEFGDDLEYGFIGFMYGGQVHFMLPMDTGLKNRMDEFADACRKARVAMPESLKNILADQLEMAELEQMAADDEAG